MPEKRILIVGCGKIGLRLATALSAEHEVWGLSRSIPSRSKMNNDPPLINFITADVCSPQSLTSQLPADLDYLIYCIAPSERTEIAYRAVYLTGLQNILSALSGQTSLKRIFFVSSTSVYHQDDHATIDETSDTRPTSFSGRVLLEAEAYCQQLISPSTIIRFSGIYGASRSRLIEQVKTHVAKLSDHSRLTNRIHEDDCVGFILHLVQRDIQEKTNEALYIASDSEPVDLNKVLKFIATALDIELEEATSSEAGNRRAGNKKCNNQKMLTSGYQLKYPSYREGYRSMITQR